MKTTRRKPRKHRTVEEIDRDLYRRIAAWAKLWEECPNAGCRRNSRCLHENDCRMHTDEPWTEEDSRWVREWLDNTRDDPAPKYDGDKVR